MGNVLKSENRESREHTTTSSTLQTPPRTPTITATSAQTLASEIHDIYHTLSKLPDLSPGTTINPLLTRLVNLCIVPYSHEFITYFFGIENIHTLCEQLQSLCATAEGELERFWARNIIEESKQSKATATNDLLNTFPYYQNYLDLSQIECSTLSAFLPPSSTSPQKFAFIGSGPLPLTSLCILDIYPSAHVHNIDRDISALQISQRLCEQLGNTERMSFACTDISLEDNVGTENTKWDEFDVVFLAALVGMDTQSKLSILESIARKLRPGALVVARSAKGLRSVLYPILEISGAMESIGLETLIEVHPWTKVVNSVIVFRVMQK
ncbi:Nicotianamine synthase [Ascochyta rabiei]|uniref:Nicotianamine synthase n=1 Tax=Didymella rabiei TaxID=5454 RepID=UPI0021FA2869|nr:Nicotianamine synthase [Ascochyta rabiei]UPX12067.1 Nicotianamine synthase [Ascochyta rabiei]